jgi:hypothetical protein
MGVDDQSQQRGNVVLIAHLIDREELPLVCSVVRDAKVELVAS